MSTTESAAVFVADDNKDLVTAQWASQAVWWNGYQQLPLSTAVNDYACDYPATQFDAITSCEDNAGPFYSIPMMDVSGNQWPISVRAATDEEELYVNATPMSSVVDHAYKYPTAQAPVDYALLECCSALSDPAAAGHNPWTSVSYADTTSSVSGYQVCCSTPMPPVSMDYCNSVQMMQYGAAFSGFSMSMNQLNPTDVHYARQQCDTSFGKAASTYVYLQGDP